MIFFFVIFLVFVRVGLKLIFLCFVFFVGFIGKLEGVVVCGVVIFLVVFFVLD